MCPLSDSLLLDAVRQAPRRHRLPPLPEDAEAARACGTEVALAYALEALRLARVEELALAAETEALFTTSLDALIRAGLPPRGGDAALQALVLEHGDATVRAYRRLAARSTADRRAVRATVDAFAHPGKLRGHGGRPMAERLAQLHRLAVDGRVRELRHAAGSLQADAARAADPSLDGSLAALCAHPALERLERMAELSESPTVRRYLALLERPARGAPAAESEAQEPEPSRRGRLAETRTIQAFARMAALLNGRPGAAERFRATGGLRTSRALPLPPQAKGEWDAALVREATHAGAAEIVLLAEVKAAPAATADDLPSLLRGLRALARTRADTVYAFASTDGALRVRGASLRRLRPAGGALPAQVVYCCTAVTEAQEARPRLLSAASKARLLAHPASLSHAARLLRGEATEPGDLAAVWRDL